MNASLFPLHDLVAIEPHDHEPDTIRGIVVPERAKQSREAKAGRVLAVGPGRMSETGTFVEVTVRPGDVVLYPKNAGVAMDSEGRVRLIRCCELIARLEESALVVP